VVFGDLTAKRGALLMGPQKAHPCAEGRHLTGQSQRNGLGGSELKERTNEKGQTRS